MKKMLAEQAYFDTTNYSPKGISSKSMDPIGTPTTQTSIMESPHFGQLQKSMQMIGEDDVDSFVFEPRRNSFSASSRLIDKVCF
jgi:hypothetical protein